MQRSIPVNAPSALKPLALLEDLKADMGITDATQDTRLSSILLEASSMAVAYIGRPILQTDWRDIFDIPPGEKLLGLVLKNYPLVQINAFSSNGTLLTGDQIAALNVEPNSGTIWPADNGVPLWISGKYVVTYTAGYIAPGDKNGTPSDPWSVPLDIQRAVRLVASSIWNSSGRDPLLKSESEQGVGSTSWNTPAPGLAGMPQSAADALARYRAGGIR